MRRAPATIAIVVVVEEVLAEALGETPAILVLTRREARGMPSILIEVLVPADHPELELTKALLKRVCGLGYAVRSLIKDQLGSKMVSRIEDPILVVEEVEDAVAVVAREEEEEEVEEEVPLALAETVVEEEVTLALAEIVVVAEVPALMLAETVTVVVEAILAVEGLVVLPILVTVGVEEGLADLQDQEDREEEDEEIRTEEVAVVTMEWKVGDSEITGATEFLSRFSQCYLIMTLWSTRLAKV